MIYIDTEVLVIGSGGAGMRAAIEASQQCRVTVMSKGFAGLDGATVTAQADIAVDSGFCRNKLGLNGDTDDSPDKFAADMLREGEFLGDESLIEVHVENSGKEVLRLKDRGVALLGLVQNPGHSYPRGVWVSGVGLCKCLKKEILDNPSINILECTVLIDLIVKNGEAVGAVGFNILDGEPVYISSKSTVLCCGGAMGLYPFVTAPDGLTGDGMAAAYRAGADLVDMEFPMFLPYSVLKPDIISGVTFTHDLAMTLNAHALNREGVRYMMKWDQRRLEHTTRDINAAAAGYEIFQGRGSENGGTYLSLAHIPNNIIEYSGEWFPKTIANWRCGGFNLKKYLPDITKEAIETIPACHFWNGGIKINADGATSLPGLFAGGEGTGSLHGANRISGNGVAQALVWGAIAGKSASRWAKNLKHTYVPSPEKMAEVVDEKTEFISRPAKEDPVLIARELKNKAWEGIGLIRTGQRLSNFEAELKEIGKKIKMQGIRTDFKKGNRDCVSVIQNRNLFDIATMVCIAAKKRDESRGAHFRCDHKETDDGLWLQNTVISLKEGSLCVKAMPANNCRGRCPVSGKRKYGEKETEEI